MYAKHFLRNFAKKIKKIRIAVLSYKTKNNGFFCCNSTTVVLFIFMKYLFCLAYSLLPLSGEMWLLAKINGFSTKNFDKETIMISIQRRRKNSTNYQFVRDHFKITGAYKFKSLWIISNLTTPNKKCDICTCVKLAVFPFKIVLSIYTHL